MDGTLYVGERPFADALDWVNRLARQGVAIAYITNNPFRPPESIGARLARMGFPLRSPEPPHTTYPILTAAVAAAQRMADLVPQGAPVLYVGSEGVRQALLEAGLEPVTSMAQDPQGVVVGGTSQWDYVVITEAVRGVRSGLPFVVTNRDPIYPYTDGIRPGTGALVAAVETAGERQGELAGKPAPHLFRLARRAFPDARNPIMVGDRLDTDVAGAHASGWAALWLNRPESPRRRMGLTKPAHDGAGVAGVAASSGDGATTMAGPDFKTVDGKPFYESSDLALKY